MKFFKKTSVAVTLTVLIVALCCVWGYTRVYVDAVPASAGSERTAGESNLNYYLGWIDDDAEFFTLDTVDELARKNLVLDSTYHSLMAVKTVRHLNGMDIQTYAENVAERMDLGSRNLLLLLDENTQAWYVFYGADIAVYIDASQDLPNLFRRHISHSFWEEDQRDEAILDLFDDLEDWYKETMPASESTGGNSIFHSDGKVPSITISALISGILLNLLANLWWIILLLVVLNIVDRVRFDRYFSKYPPGTSPAPRFHPFLFWHRAGSNWYEDRVEEAMAEDEEEEAPPEDDPGGDSSQSHDHYQRGPGYSTDPNEPGPFGPQPGPGPQVNTAPPPASGLMGQLLQLFRNLLELFWQCLDALAHFIRRM
ncbi:MAG: TPM domain-containing protein [Bacillota bacterium]|nr:TPM domain-containing protein [Bacillota bacterium]